MDGGRGMYLSEVNLKLVVEHWLRNIDFCSLSPPPFGADTSDTLISQM